ncbi:MAG TPA: helix-turn-helix transcriptional regulator, partial [Amycolatopsis sp.]|nr:helix-turn-helix transcriptional regulator [Amycolatopsis sp.]
LRRAATLVVTLRSGETAPDAITSLWKDGHLDRLELRPLSEAETGDLLEAALGGPVDAHGVHALWKITGGNVLFLRHLVDSEVTAGRLREYGGLWRWPGPFELSPRLTELVDARVGQLSAGLRDVIDLLAFGEPLGASTLMGLTDPRAVQEAEERGLITVEPDARRLPVRLAHPLYGEVQRARTSVLRARVLRGRLAAAMGTRRADDRLRRAVLMLDSDLAPEAGSLVEAGWHATELYDLPLARRLAHAGCAAGGGFPAHLLLSYVLSWQGFADEAEQELDAVFTLAVTDDERAEATLPRVGNLFFGLRRTSEAEAVLDAALARTPTVALEAMRSAVDGFLGRPQSALTGAERILARPDLPPQAVLLACWGLAHGLGALGRAAELRTTLDKWRVSEATASMLHFGLAHLRLTALRLAGLLTEMHEVAGHYAELAQDIPGIAQPIADVLGAEAATARGQVRTAARLAREARAAVSEDADPGGWVFGSLLALTSALGMAGDAAGARAALADLAMAAHPAFVFRDPEVTLARAWVAAAEGAVSEATALARDAARTAAALDEPAQEVVASHTAVCFGDRTTADRLARLVSCVDGRRAPVAARHAAALAAGDGAGLDAAAADLERMGALLLAADAAAQASATHERRGDRLRAKASAARAGELATACEGAHTPALVAIEQPLPLTAREREIATLVAAGWSNRDIAVRLTVSVRTVEGHVYRACTKLGTADRAGLAEAITSRKSR